MLQRCRRHSKAIVLVLQIMACKNLKIRAGHRQDAALQNLIWDPYHCRDDQFVSNHPSIVSSSATRALTQCTVPSLIVTRRLARGNLKYRVAGKTWPSPRNHGMGIRSVSHPWPASAAPNYRGSEMVSVSTAPWWQRSPWADPPDSISSDG